MNVRIHVAVGVIYHPDYPAVLISKRQGEQHFAGYWEFPGGKIQDNENTLEALSRELHEELGINIIEAYPLLKVEHDYNDKKVLLDVWHVDSFSGEPSGKEGQDVRWITIDNLSQYNFPPANKRIMNRLQLPSLCLLSEEKITNIQQFEQVIKDCLLNELRFMVMRLGNEASTNVQYYIELIKALPGAEKMKLVLNGLPEQLNDYQINGIHLKARYLYDYSSRPVEQDKLLGASCHNEKELEQAVKLGCDYAFLSPVKPTSTHPGVSPMGWQNFNALCQKADLPVYALGGLSIDDFDTAINAGATGIVLKSGIWGVEEPGKTLSQITNS